MIDSKRSVTKKNCPELTEITAISSSSETQPGSYTEYFLIPAKFYLKKTFPTEELSEAEYKMFLETHRNACSELPEEEKTFYHKEVEKLILEIVPPRFQKLVRIQLDENTPEKLELSWLDPLRNEALRRSNASEPNVFKLLLERTVNSLYQHRRSLNWNHVLRSLKDNIEEGDRLIVKNNRIIITVAKGTEEEEELSYAISTFTKDLTFFRNQARQEITVTK